MPYTAVRASFALEVGKAVPRMMVARKVNCHDLTPDSSLEAAGEQRISEADDVLQNVCMALWE